MEIGGYVDKVVRDGKVAVVFSPGYGAGWYTWNLKYPELLFHPQIVAMIENDTREFLTEEFIGKCLNLSKDDCECLYLSPSKLQIQWIAQGSLFRINEYDGSESIILQENDNWIIA
jgi:hypothetical protein